jgi:hypothetical protein
LLLECRVQAAKQKILLLVYNTSPAHKFIMLDYIYTQARRYEAMQPLPQSSVSVLHLQPPTNPLTGQNQHLTVPEASQALRRQLLANALVGTATATELEASTMKADLGTPIERNDNRVYSRLVKQHVKAVTWADFPPPLSRCASQQITCWNHFHPGCTSTSMPLAFTCSASASQTCSSP